MKISSDRENNNILLKELFDRYFGHMVIFVGNIVGSRPLAEDIVQDVFLDLWEKDNLPKCTTQFLYRCMKNAAINHLKSKAARIDHVSETILNAIASEEDEFINELERMERIEKLYKAIEQLPPQCRAVLREVYLGKQKYADVSVKMNISLNTVRAHMYTAFKLLREYLVASVTIVMLCFRSSF
jgi:RNA polymerase sigma-70 factor (family 1)